ncbi:penicillin acylase family protein [Ideonella sp. A 288]|uniref:penicillin acylase family protein n=1 Tax=Ideonella sp. A 288 TaxID=1962181 RepID=UPI000B4B9579|nr:penicillin acylase family protein [Ideonella sp. A 288]
MRWMKRGGLLVLVLVLLAAAAAWIYSRRVLPQVDGTLALPGLGAEVRVERDEHGIATIRAGSLDDAMHALGVLHVQDRLWQMETHRRIGAGRLAEAFGEGAVDTDRVLRTLGVRRAAQAQWAQTTGPARQVLLAYTRGVNAALAEAVRALPPEFLILGVRPEPWDPVDSLAWSIMMAWDLGGNWTHELMRLRLALKLPKARIDEVLPPYPGEAPLPSRDYAALYRELKLEAPRTALAATIDRLLAAAPASGLEGVGSNNWVLSGSRTATGTPLLANDPHLKLSAPALWYFARIVTPELTVAGATLPGLPGVVLGQSPHIAWGFTNTGPDVQDLYLERVDPADPGRYQTPDGWARFETVAEVIRVKGKPDVPIVVRRTRHGPVISDAGLADDVPGVVAQAGHVLAMRWTGLDADTDSVGTSLRMAQAKSVAEFIDATRGWVAPMQTMVVADRDGHIGFIAPGRVPVRQPANDLFGLAPAPGWEARYDWDGWLPFDALPQQRDPAAGFIASANQRIVPPDYPHFLSSNWALPHRHNRIVQMLESRPKHSIDDLRVMQADVRSLAAPPLLAWLKKARSPHALAAAAQQQLAAFDGDMRGDGAGGLVYWAWSRHLSRRLLADELGPFYVRTLGMRGYYDAIEGVMARNDAWWCDDKGTADAVETCAAQADAALTEALDELQVLQGANPATWRWDRTHLARSEHRPFSRVKALARWFELRTSVGGDTYTVNVSRVGLVPDAATGEFYLSDHGASLRGLYDLADPNRSRIMHSTGQSGVPWSPLYRSFVEPWTRVEFVPLWPAPGARSEVLVLTPAAGAAR